MTGALGRLLPGSTADVHAAASLYAELARQRGWLRPDRVLEAAPFTRLRETATAWATQDRTWPEVIEAFGPPSILFGSTNPRYSKTLGYLTDDSTEPMVFFHLWNGPDPSARDTWSGTRDQPVLLAVRHGGTPLPEALTYTPEAQRLQAAAAPSP